MTTSAPVLMSANNPTGWKLEDLLSVLRDEIVMKNAQIEHGEDGEPERKAYVRKEVWSNNRMLLQMLSNAEMFQRDSLKLLDRLGPDQGPLGRPRVGNGPNIEPEQRTFFDMPMQGSPFLPLISHEDCEVHRAQAYVADGQQ